VGAYRSGAYYKREESGSEEPGSEEFGSEEFGSEELGSAVKYKYPEAHGRHRQLPGTGRNFLSSLKPFAGNGFDGGLRK